jgi:hypothetical protein
MAQCSKCGGPLNEGQAFCPACGQAVGAAVDPATAAAQTPPVAPVQPTAPPTPAGYAPPAYAPGGVYAPGAYPSAKGSKKGLWIGVAAAAVIIAVACALVFGVFKDKIFDGGGTAAKGPEKAVQLLLNAMESKNIDKFFDLVAPASLESLESFGLTIEDAKDMIAEELFSYDSIEFSDIEMETTDTGDGTATVTITGGSVTITADGATETEEATESDAPVEFYCIESDGKWYIDIESME